MLTLYLRASFRKTVYLSTHKVYPIFQKIFKFDVCLIICEIFSARSGSVFSNVNIMFVSFLSLCRLDTAYIFLLVFNVTLYFNLGLEKYLKIVRSKTRLQKFPIIKMSFSVPNTAAIDCYMFEWKQ